jgi:hypothetical protein
MKIELDFNSTKYNSTIGLSFVKTKIQKSTIACFFNKKWAK